MQSRRTVVLGALAASFAAGPMATAQEGEGPAPPVFGDGVAGGGTFESPAGEGEFSLVAFAQDRGDGSADYAGTFSLSDPTALDGPLTMTGESVSGYTAPDEEKPDVRRVIGWANANGSGPFPYILDVDLPAEGDPEGVATLVVLFGDSAAILMGNGKEAACDCGGFDYRVKATVTRGGVSRFTIPQGEG